MDNFETCCHGSLHGDDYKDWEGSTCVIYFTLVSLVYRQRHITNTSGSLKELYNYFGIQVSAVVYSGKIQGLIKLNSHNVLLMSFL